jgi:hypothetical protein
MPEPAPTLDTLRFLNEEVSARAGRLDANTTRLDTKATTLLGFILAACTFLATQPISGWWKVMPRSWPLRHSDFSPCDPELSRMLHNPTLCSSP